MIKRDVKSLLPVYYNLDDAQWYRTIREDYENYAYRVILVSYVISILFPVISLLYELITGLNRHLLNYSIPSAIMALMIMYLVVFKNVRVMRRIAVLTAFIGLFCSILLPGSHLAYMIIFFNFIPLIFSLSGLRGGISWFVTYTLSLVLLFILFYSGNELNLNFYADSSLIPVSVLTILIMFAITYSSQKQHENIIKKLVRSIVYDSSTGLPNKDSFLRCMHDIDHSIIAILQITNFRNLSALFGYEFSDRILIKITEALQKYAERDGFRIYKLSWHEFGLQIPVDPDITLHSARNNLCLLINELCKKRISHDGMKVNVSFSIGGAIIRDRDYSEALSKADNALTSALSTHKSVVLHNPDMNVKLETIILLQRYALLYDNVVNSTLKSFLQPVVSTDTGKVCLHESLLRLRRNDGNYESIYGYIDIAKDTSLYSYLTDFMLDNSVRLIKLTGLPVSINICQFDMLNPSVLKKIEKITSGSEYRDGDLILEIIESEDLNSFELCREFIEKAGAMGVKIAIDDFGAGYSNIANLLRLPVNYVKIDGSLIRSMETDRDAFTFIHGLATFCKNTGKKIIAEFVENETLLNMARKIGIDYCQGYYFGIPSDPDSVKDEETCDRSCQISQSREILSGTETP